MTPGETGQDHARPSLATSAAQMLVREAARAPLVALSLGLQAWERTRGLRDMARRRRDEALQIAAHTPLGRLLPHEIFGDNAEAEGRRIAEHARKATARVTTPSEPVATAAQGAARPAEEPAAGPPPEARAAGAPGAATDEVEERTRQLAVPEPVSREELPIPDFDNVSLASLRARLRSLSVEQLVTLREWEQAHAHRLPVITLLDNRIAKLSGDTTATGAGAARRAEQAAQDQGGTLRV